MAKTQTQYVCQSCGAQSPRWQGKCPQCGQWSTLAEETTQSRPFRSPRPTGDSSPRPLPDIETSDAPRLPTGNPELDRLLGGGIVPGGAVLIGGDPGIGKSTLLLQTCREVALSGRTVLYVTGEESALQIRMRADRLGPSPETLLILAETALEPIQEAIRKTEAALVVVDSVQMLYSEEVGSAPGSVGQVRECSAKLVFQGKQIGTPVFLVGHVTKDGSIAGPRTLEHLVDTVLYFEGDRFHAYRLLRSVKNRFGSTQELGVFEMTSRGLEPVDSPSRFFLSPGGTARTGCAVAPALEGSRAMLVELQGLTAPAHFGTPERRVSGADYVRTCMLLAVLERRAGLHLKGQDIFVNAVGGARVEEPGCDLAVAMAIASSFLDRPLPETTAVIGEVGLGGEVRPAPRLELRLKETARMGFTRVILPKEAGKPTAGEGLERIEVETVREALELLE